MGAISACETAERNGLIVRSCGIDVYKRQAYANHLATMPEPEDLLKAVRTQMYDPVYESYV